MSTAVPSTDPSTSTSSAARPSPSLRLQGIVAFGDIAREAVGGDARCAPGQRRPPYADAPEAASTVAGRLFPRVRAASPRTVD